MSGSSTLRHGCAALLVVMLGACGTSAPPAATATASSNEAGGAQANAVTRIGDTSIRASVVQTSTLDRSVAAQYALPRDPKTVLLLVTVRRGPDATAVAVPATIEATVTDLRGDRQALALREVRTGDAIDYVATAATSLPDTLRFDIQATLDGGAHARLQLNQDFYPR